MGQSIDSGSSVRIRFLETNINTALVWNFRFSSLFRAKGKIIINCAVEIIKEFLDCGPFIRN